MVLLYVVHLVDGECDGEGRHIGDNFVEEEKLGSGDAHLQWVEHRHLCLHFFFPLLVVLGFSLLQFEDVLIEWHFPLELDGHDEGIVPDGKLDGVDGGVGIFILGRGVVHVI